jgi:hypothetical protein
LPRLLLLVLHVVVVGVLLGWPLGVPAAVLVLLGRLVLSGWLGGCKATK